MAIPLSTDDQLRVQRCTVYASGTVLLDEDHEVPHATAIYDTALCNGLAVIVAARSSGSELRPNGQVKSAEELLRVIVSEEAKAGHIGKVLVLEEPDAAPVGNLASTIWGDDVTLDPGVRIEVATLRDALTATAPVRHGKLRKKSFQRKHVDALIALDSHPQLGVLANEHGDRQWTKERVRDLWRRGQAEQYLEMLSTEEIERRVQGAADELLPFDPKERAASLGLRECPVCDQETLLATHLDDVGAVVATGTCFVCGYYRSPSIADDQGFNFMWANKWKHE